MSLRVREMSPGAILVEGSCHVNSTMTLGAAEELTGGSEQRVSYFNTLPDPFYLDFAGLALGAHEAIRAARDKMKAPTVRGQFVSRDFA